jgi:pSer/pThr/pTyr-binding forkhead associated (FHA) protein
MDLGNRRYDSQTRKTHTSISHYTSRQARMFDQKVGSHMRMKQSRGAMERSGNTPAIIAWQGSTFSLAGDLIRIGREPDNDVVIDDDEVSEHHCQIVREGEDLYLEDLNSSNGTFANGGVLADRLRLSVGDVVTIGSVLFQFLEEQPA